MGQLIMTYWAEILLAAMVFIKVLVNLTPTTIDNKVFGWIDVLINAIVSDRRTQRQEKRKKAKEDK